MILSSADILRILQRSTIISGSARISIVDNNPALSGKEGLFVYIERFPSVEEFEVTWRIWIESDGSEPDDLVIEEMKRLLPRFKIRPGLLIEASVTDFKSRNTEVRPEAPSTQPSVELANKVEKRFADLTQEIQDRMLLVNSGRSGSDGIDGKDGLPGPAGPPGRDGKDLLVTDAVLNDLNDVEIADTIPLKKSQVLTYDGSRWTNLYIPRLTSSSGGGGSSTVITGGSGTTIAWIEHDETGEPHNRKFHVNNTDITLVTEIHVSKTNQAGNDVELLLEAILPISGQIYLTQVSDPSQAHLFSITSYSETTDGFLLVVAHVETPGPESALIENQAYNFLFLSSSSVSGGIPEAPQDGGYYVRRNGQWVNLSVALGAFDNRDFDGGNLTTGTSDSIDNAPLDGGDFTT
jgi:hypothetical protein